MLGLAQTHGLDADRVLYIAAAGLGEGVTGTSDFPATKDAAQYSLMVRNDAVVGLMQGNPGLFHGQSALAAGGVTRLESGGLVAGDVTSTDLEDYNVPGNSTPTVFDAHSTVFLEGTTAFKNIVNVITGGRVAVFAEDLVSARGTTIYGNDRSGYTPKYEAVK